MAEETKTTTATPATATPAAEAESAAAVDPVGEWLAKATPEEILKHDRVRGILGSRLDVERQRIRQELSEEQDRRAREQAEADLLELAKANPFEFSQRYLTKAEQDRIKRETENLRTSTRAEFAKQLGRGYSALPEWSELTPAEQETLQNAVKGKSDDDALVAFNAAAVDVIADRRATKRQAEFREKDLAKEREAIRQEEAAKRLKASERPSMDKSGTEPSKGGWQDLPAGKDFNREYEKNVLGRR